MSASRRPRFLVDLTEELTWLRDHAGTDVAGRWYDALVATLHSIEKNPFVGRVRKDLKPAGIRSWRVRGFPRWLIFYGVTPDDDVIFYRVRSGTMNLVVIKMKS